MAGNRPSQTRLSVETHSFSSRRLCDYPAFVESLLIVKKAAATANGKAGHVPSEIAARIVENCDRLQSSAWETIFEVDVFQGGGGIAINSNLNEAIAEKIDSRDTLTIDPCEHVNASQSTADVCATAARISLVKLHNSLHDALVELETSLHNLTTKFQDTPSIARTCLQDAMPAPLGVLFSGYHAAVQRRRLELSAAAQALKSVNLGGTVIGSGEGASTEYRQRVYTELNQLLPFEVRPRDNLHDAAQNSDDLGHLAAELGLLAYVLLKISKDLRLLASGPAGFHEIRLPKIIEGSSFFQSKNNPTIVETLMNCCFLILGRNRTVEAAVEHAELHLNVFDLTAAICLYESLESLTNAVQNFNRHCLAGIEVA